MLFCFRCNVELLFVCFFSLIVVFHTWLLPNSMPQVWNRTFKVPQGNLTKNVFQSLQINVPFQFRSSEPTGNNYKWFSFSRASNFARFQLQTWTERKQPVLCKRMEPFIGERPFQTDGRQRASIIRNEKLFSLKMDDARYEGPVPSRHTKLMSIPVQNWSKIETENSPRLALLTLIR